MCPWAPAPRTTWRSTERSECWGVAGASRGLRELAQCWYWGRGYPSPRACPLPTAGPSPRFCGERPQFVVASRSSRITVHFHSDQSYTDTGFLAEYLSYDSSDRE